MLKNLRKIKGTNNLYRSNEFDNINEKEFNNLKEIINVYNNKLFVIDLRNNEVEKKFSNTRREIKYEFYNLLSDELYKVYYKNSLLKDKINALYNIYIMQKSEKYSLTQTLNNRNVAEMYIDFLEGSKKEIKKIFTKMIELGYEYKIIINCKYGKDRTGVISMLIMLLCDIKKETIIEEYSKSFLLLLKNDFDKNIDKLVKDFKKGGLDKKFIYSFENYMISLLDLFELKYKNIKSYLENIGIDEQEQQRFKNFFKNK
jgi:protein tyrosine/serine phosphatase